MKEEIKIGDILYGYYTYKKLLCAFFIVKVNKKSFHYKWLDITENDTEEKIREMAARHNGKYTGGEIDSIGKRLFFTKKEAFDNPI